MIKRVGFPCTSFALELSTNHSFKLPSLNEARLRETVERNLADLDALLEWMAPHDLRFFRLGSSFVPFASHEAMVWDWEAMVGPGLEHIATKHAAAEFRFTVHPGQYTLLNSDKPDVVSRAVAELDYSARLLDFLGPSRENTITLHIGCVCGDREASVERLLRAVDDLPDRIRRRLTFENDEHHYAFDEVLRVSEATGVPAVFDVFHHTIKPCERVVDRLVRAAKVWTVRPETHLSSQRPGAKVGAHADLIDPADAARLVELLPFDADVMVEAKGKEAAALGVLRAFGRE